MRAPSACATVVVATSTPRHAIRTDAGYGTPAPPRKRGLAPIGPRGSAIAQRRERADEIARGIPRISVLVGQRLQRRVGARARVLGEAALIARQQLDQIADPLGDRLLVLLEVRVAQL